MIVEGIDERLRNAFDGMVLAQAMDLQWQVNLVANPLPDGRSNIVVQFLFNYKSVLLGQRLWDVTQTEPAGLLAADDATIQRIAFEIVQRLEGQRQAQARLSN